MTSSLQFWTETYDNRGTNKLGKEVEDMALPEFHSFYTSNNLFIHAGQTVHSRGGKAVAIGPNIHKKILYEMYGELVEVMKSEWQRVNCGKVDIKGNQKRKEDKIK